MIPLGWAETAEDGMREFVLIPDKTPIEFIIESCESGIQNFRGEPAEIWALKLTCTSGNLKSNVWHNVYKDGKSIVWNDKDRNGNPWIQNKFMNLCSAVDLRRSGDDSRINPLWFTNPACFIGKRGRAIIGVESWQDKMRNRINWFNSASKQQELQNESINNRIFSKVIEPVPSSQPREAADLDADPFA